MRNPSVVSKLPHPTSLLLYVRGNRDIIFVPCVFRPYPPVAWNRSHNLLLSVDTLRRLSEQHSD